MSTSHRSGERSTMSWTDVLSRKWTRMHVKAVATIRRGLARVRLVGTWVQREVYHGHKCRRTD